MEILPKQTTSQTAGLAEEAKKAMVGGRPSIPAEKMKFSPPKFGEAGPPRFGEAGPPRFSPRSGGAGGEAGPPAKTGLKLPPLKQIGRGIQESKWPVVAGVVILALVILVWGGFFFYYKSLVSQKANLEKRVEELNSAESRETTKKILDLESGLKEIKGLLGAHIFSSGAFKLLEDNVLPGVRLLNFNLDVRTADIVTSGLAQTYSTLAKQLLVLEKLDAVKEIKVSGVSLNQLGGVGFQMNIILNKDFFTR